MSHPHQTPSPAAPPHGHGYGQPPGHGYPPGYGYGYGPAPTNGLAITALILGIVSLLGGIIPILGWFASPFALAAVGFGIAGLSRGKRVGRGRGLAAGGLVTGVLALLAITAWTALIVKDANDRQDLLTGDDRYWGCDAIRDSYEDNVEEFRDEQGREPQHEDDLIDEGYRTWASPDWDVVVIDGRAEVVAEAGGEC